ncbi:MAG: hypothetical protein HYV62_10635 [Candidatus Rokubacteria bacterium]|nr:hypothetical protein [Candidatus Rokubacteria bacterium]
MRRPQKVLLVAGLLFALALPFAWAGPPEPFVAGGSIDSITVGEVTPAGESGRFAVKAREVSGWISINGSGWLPYTFTFGTNVPLTTQSGQIHGTLTAGPYTAQVHAMSEIGATPISCEVAPSGTPCLGGFIPGLLLDGTFALPDGAHGQGTASAWLVPILGPDGHIVAVFGQVTLIGQWQP